MPTQTKQITNNYILPSLIATKEFRPTSLMLKILTAYLIEKTRTDIDKPRSPTKLLVSLGHARIDWYDWLKKPYFLDWWNKALVSDFYTKTAKIQVYEGILRRAKDNSPQDAKTYLERFDDDYKPQTAQEHKFPGIAPTSPEQLQEATERSRRRIDSHTIGEVKPDEDTVVADSHNDSQDVGQEAH